MSRWPQILFPGDSCLTIGFPLRRLDEIALG